MRFLILILGSVALIFLVVYYLDVEQLSTDFPVLSILSKTEEKPKHYTRANKPLPRCATESDKPAKSFLMVFMSRSGSTAISQTLSLHPLVKHMFEFLEDSNVPRNDIDQALNVTETFFQKTIASGKIPGFKIRAHYILTGKERWAKLIEKYDTRVIWQYRKNVFKTSVGIYRRIVFGDYTATGGIPTTALDSTDKCSLGIGCSFRIDNWKQFHSAITGRIVQDVEMVKAVRALDGNRSCVFEMPYEDYLYYKKDSLKAMFAFLGLKLQSLETFRAKATSDSLCNVIENFDELCEKYYGCPFWQPFLDDFENDCRCTNFTHSSEEYCSTEHHEVR